MLKYYPVTYRYGYQVNFYGRYIHTEVARDHYMEHIKFLIKLGHKVDIHHIDMDKRNNKPKNLMPLPAAFHKWLHEDNAAYWMLRNRPDVKEILSELESLYLSGCLDLEIEPLFESVAMFIDE